MTRVRREDAARSQAAAAVPAKATPEANRPSSGGAETLAITVNPGERGPSYQDHAEPGDETGEELGEEGSSSERDPVDAEALARDLPEPARASEDRERDRDLVARAQKGERHAFRDLFERHHKRAYAVAYGVLKNKHDALDVVQEAFVKVHKHLDSFQGSSSFYTWLYRIVMNLAIDQLRRRKTAKPVEYDDSIAREGESADDTILPRMMGSNPRKAAIRRELMVRVEQALAQLPEYHRQVIVLREIEGLSYEEMAEVLEVPKGTIMSRLFHARRKMQVALQDFVEGGDHELEEE